VKSIEIKVNGKTYQTYTFTRQAFKSGTVVHYYNVEAKPGDVIEVTATSTTNESKTETLNVEDAKQP
jgi:ribosomal protein S17